MKYILDYLRELTHLKYVLGAPIDKNSHSLSTSSNISSILYFLI